MYPFIETIRIEKGGIENLVYHTRRLNETRAVYYPGSTPINLADYIHPPVEAGVFKCRIVYDQIIREITYAPYTVRPVHSLRIVLSDTIDYRYKSSDREALSQLFAQREAADEVLIVRNRLLTDTSIANIALYDGADWFTPSTPLLRGTRRAALIAEHRLVEREIRLEQLFAYSHIALFNAMIPFEQVILPIREGITIIN